jgi:heme-degrading monooxygenase HmoA
MTVRPFPLFLLLSLLAGCSLLLSLASGSMETSLRDLAGILLGDEQGLAGQVVRELRSQAMHAEGFISGETLRSIEDPSVHLVISTWQSLDAWNAWIKSPRREAIQKRVDEILTEPSTRTAFQFE